MITASLVVATIRGAEELTGLIESLRTTQHLAREDFEVIIVDNATTSQQEVVALCTKHGLTYLHCAVPGKSNALNHGINGAQGKYIVFTDDDARVENDKWLNTLLAHFKSNTNLGYVSGNVIAAETKTAPQQMWEKKGALSKGDEQRHWSQADFANYRWQPWPLALFCAGANCVIPKEILLQVNGLCTLLGPGAPVPHGESLEVVYRIIKAGYEVLYDPASVVLHNHPETATGVKQRLYVYDVGNTAIHAHIFSKHRDYRSLLWALGGQQCHVLKKMLLRLSGKYHLPMSYLWHSLKGTLVGNFVYIRALIKTRNA